MALEVDGQRFKEIEVMAAEMETRLRESILRVLRPTLTQISDIDHRQKELLQVVESHGRNMDKVDQLQFEVIKQSQLTKVMEDTTASMANQVRELETVYGQQYLDVKSAQDLQQSSLTAVKNDIDRLSREDTRIWDEALRLQHQHEEALRTNRDSMTACHKRIDREREELDDRLDVMNSQRLPLLTKELKELTDFAAPIPSMLRRITDTERGLKDLTKRQESLEKDFEENRVEWHQYVQHQDEEMAEMKETFRKQCNSLVAHNAEIMRDIRRDYHFEIKGVEEMRKEIAESLKQVVQISDETEEKVDKERFRIDRIQKEVKQEIREMGKTQLADRAKNDQRAEQIRMDLEEERELNAPARAQFDSVSKLTGLLLEGCRVGCALALQDFADRSQERWLCFPGERPMPATPLKASELEKQRQAKEDPPQRELTEVITDLRKGLTRSGYQPGQVHFSGHSFDRRDLLVLHSRLLQKAQQTLAHGGEEKGKLSKAEDVVPSPVGKAAAPNVSPKDGRAPPAKRNSFASSTVLNLAKEATEVKAQKWQSGSQSARAPRGRSNPSQPLNSTWQPGWPQKDGGVHVLRKEQLAGDWVKLPTIAAGRKATPEDPPKVATPPTSRPGTGADPGAGNLTSWKASG